MEARIRSMALLLVVGMGVVACGDERSRPVEPLGNDDMAELSQAPLIRITDPGDGEAVPRASFTEPPGRPVTLEGSFLPGLQVRLEGFALQYGPIPFHSEQYEIMAEGVRARHFMTANVFHLDRSDRARLFVRVWDGRDLISVDSVEIQLQ